MLVQFEFRSSVCVRDGAVFNCMVACWLSTSSVSLGARGDQRSAAEGSSGCFTSSSPCDVQLSYPNLTPASRCTSSLLKTAPAPTPLMSAPRVGGPGGQPSFPCLPTPKKYVGDYFITGLGRVAQLAGQGMKCLGWELLGRERCWQSPGLWLQPDKLDFISSPRSCGLFLGPPLLLCLSLPQLTPVCLWLPEGGAGKDEASGCGERRCRLTPV